MRTSIIQKERDVDVIVSALKQINKKVLPTVMRIQNQENKTKLTPQRIVSTKCEIVTSEKNELRSSSIFMGDMNKGSLRNAPCPAT